METTVFDEGIKVMYVEASSFPDGIVEAHRRLHAMIPFTRERKYFGISRPENGVIVYKAAAEELSPGEARKLKCDTLILKKGKYIGITLKDYQKNIQAISETFQSILSHPGLDPDGYCVEWYFNETDVKCLVRLDEK